MKKRISVSLGLSYSIDRESDTCEVRAFTGEDAQTASDFFTFNQQPEFQYVGMVNLI